MNIDPSNPQDHTNYSLKKQGPVGGWPGEVHVAFDAIQAEWRKAVILKAKKAGACALEGDNSDNPHEPVPNRAKMINAECAFLKSLGMACSLKNNQEVIDSLDHVPEIWIIEAGGEAEGGGSNGGTGTVTKAKGQSKIPPQNIYVVYYGAPDQKVCDLIPGAHFVFSVDKKLNPSSLKPCPNGGGGSGASNSGQPAPPPPAQSAQELQRCAKKEPPPEPPPEDPPPKQPPPERVAQSDPQPSSPENNSGQAQYPMASPGSQGSGEMAASPPSRPRGIKRWTPPLYRSPAGIPGFRPSTITERPHDQLPMPAEEQEARGISPQRPGAGGNPENIWAPGASDAVGVNGRKPPGGEGRRVAALTAGAAVSSSENMGLSPQAGRIAGGYVPGMASKAASVNEALASFSSKSGGLGAMAPLAAKDLNTLKAISLADYVGNPDQAAAPATEKLDFTIFAQIHQAYERSFSGGRLSSGRILSPY